MAGSEEKEDWKRQLDASIDAFSTAAPVIAETPHQRQATGESTFPRVDPNAVVAPRPVPKAQPVAAPEPTKSITPAGSGSLLDRLKRQAEEKMAGEARDEDLAANRAKAVGDTLAQIYSYLNELCAQLNILRQSWPHPMYLNESLSFADLKWEEGRADYRKRTGPAENQPFERVSLRFKMVGPSEIVIERENPAMETLRKFLVAQGIPFELDEIRNAKAYVERGKFKIKPEIRAGMLFVGNFETGDLSLKVLNLPRLGSTEYLVPVAELTPEIMEEIALLAIGESTKFFKHFKRLA